ncbi:post-transcriptional regulator [Falsibacillus pallidus]|uniref:ComN-like post-transcriptional regulator n=1 Tax=Falsibacillus pallidus TaxID=493781 RepID=A0A370GK15_9BACI|nr:post-transcriptional regulator [Falsibacillus pallidus]RDI44118.1 ComN-like post-transcriptional regulator [Falsibacillus pallidus]
MKDDHPYRMYYDSLEPAMLSKIEEFSLFGYGEVSIVDLWQYLTKKKWKKPEPSIRMHQLVHDILSVKVSEFMTFATIEAYRSPNWFTEVDEDELQELLHPKGK